MASNPVALDALSVFSLGGPPKSFLVSHSKPPVERQATNGNQQPMATCLWVPSPIEAQSPPLGFESCAIEGSASAESQATIPQKSGSKTEHSRLTSFHRHFSPFLSDRPGATTTGTGACRPFAPRDPFAIHWAALDVAHAIFIRTTNTRSATVRSTHLAISVAICCHMLHGDYWKHQVKSKVMKGWDGLWKLFSNSRHVPHCPILSNSIEFAAFSVRFLELMPPLQVRLHLLQPSQDDHLRWNSWNVICQTWCRVYPYLSSFHMCFDVFCFILSLLHRFAPRVPRVQKNKISKDSADSPRDILPDHTLSSRWDLRCTPGTKMTKMHKIRRALQ